MNVHSLSATPQATRHIALKKIDKIPAFPEVYILFGGWIGFKKKINKIEHDRSMHTKEKKKAEKGIGLRG